MLFTVSAAAPAFSRAQAEAWLKGEHGPLAGVSPRGLVAGLQKCGGLLALSLSPHAPQFTLLLALPT